MRQILLILSPALLSACSSGGQSKQHEAPAKTEPVSHETELLRLTLTQDARQRLGIQTVQVGEGSLPSARAASGEIVIPPSGPGGLPTGSTANLQQIAAQQAAADGDIAKATAQEKLARIALARADALVREDAGSMRARDEATAALATARATLDMARTQRRLLGPAVGAMSRQNLLWVRATLFSSDLPALRRDATATVRPLGDGGQSRQARPVDAPPAANAGAGTVDLFYALPGDSNERFTVGQRVAVAIPMTDHATGLSVPSAAILRDIHGGEWVYEQTGPNSYIRQRVEIASEGGGTALLARGLRTGAKVVTAGAAELFGTEFGAAH